MDPALLDTDIFSEILKGRNLVVRENATRYLAQHGRLAVSTITVLEVVRGLSAKALPERQRQFEERLASIEILTLTPTGARLAGRILAALGRLGRPIGAYDPLIAAIAIEHERVLVTGNEAHYAMVAEAGFPLRLENWRHPSAS